jgi:DNA invertase Pin-like site-specific DNA recombinase
MRGVALRSLSPGTGERAGERGDGVKLRAALYTRTSAADLVATAPELLAELRRYATGVRGWDVALELADRGPGIKGRREGLADLVTAIRGGEVDVVVTTSLARLCRNLSRVLDMADLLEAGSAEVALVALDDVVDTTTPDGRVRWRDAVDLFRRIRHAQRSEEVRLARIKGALKGVDDKWGRPIAAINPLELAGYWHGTPAQRPLSVKEIAAKLAYGEGTIRRRIRELLEAGKLHPEVRARHLATAGGLKKGGRPPKSRIDPADLAVRWHAGEPMVALRKVYHCGAGRIKDRLAELRREGRLDDELRKTNIEGRKKP